MIELNAEKAKILALQSSYDEEKLMRMKAESRLNELRRVHETLACNSQTSEEFIVNKVFLTSDNLRFDSKFISQSYLPRSTLPISIPAANLQDRSGKA